MSAIVHITAHVLISDQQVFKNAALVYENKEVDAPGFLMAAYQHLGIKYPKFYKMDHLCKLGWLAAEVLLSEAELAQKYQAEEVGLVLSNANSSLDADLKYFESVKEIASPALFVYTLPNIVIGEISIKHKFKGENAFFIFEQFDADFIQKYVSDLFNNDILQACICGWVEWMGNHYKAVLFLVEKGSLAAGNINFTTEQLNKIYHSNNG